jgi:hypothetical protein
MKSHFKIDGLWDNNKDGLLFATQSETAEKVPAPFEKWGLSGIFELKSLLSST